MSDDWKEQPLPPQGVINVMSLRDYFAAQVVPIFIGRIMDRFGKDDMSVSHAVAAEAAYCLADAMLAERDK